MSAYITSSGIISPQPTYEGKGFPAMVREVVSDRLLCLEPDYKELINPLQLRRMPRILKMGLAASKLCLNRAEGINPDAIIIGTGLGCLDNLEKFLIELLDTGEHVTSVIPFINSTHNAVAAQVAMLLKNHGYNMTYCHRGLSFEGALIDALMHVEEQMAVNILVGGIDECTDDFVHIHGYHHYWKMTVSNLQLYEQHTMGTMAGEGSAFFMLSSDPKTGEDVYVKDVHTFLAGEDSLYDLVTRELEWFLNKAGISREQIDVAITGMNGDAGMDAIYDSLSKDYFIPGTGIARYKHLCGEYYTSSSFALWLGALILRDQFIPPDVVHTTSVNKSLKNLLIYNHIRNKEHAFILMGHGAI